MVSSSIQNAYKIQYNISTKEKGKKNKLQTILSKCRRALTD